MSRKEWPPFLRKNKDESAPEVQQETLILAPAPAALDATELINQAYRGDAAATINELDSFYEGTRSYASHRELYADPRVRAMYQRKQEAITLAVKLSQSSEGEKPSIASQLDNAIQALTDQAGEVEVAAESNEARNTTSREATQNEERVAFKETVQKASSETGSLLKIDGLTRAIKALKALDDSRAKSPPEDNGRDLLELTMEQQLPEEPTGKAEPFKNGPTSMRNIDRATATVAREKNIMHEAEKQYLTAYKDYHKKITARDGKEPESLQMLSRVYNTTRLEYRDALDEQATHRIKDKIRNGSMDKAAGDKLLERYDRMVMYREVIRPAAEKRYQARLEAKGESHTAAFKNGMGWLGRKNQEASRWLEEKTGSKNGAKFARAVATTVVVGGAAAAVGAFGAAGVMAALGWGTLRLARSLASMALGASVGEAAAQAYGATIGSKREEKHVLIKAEADAELARESRAVPERAQALNFSSIDDLEAYDVQREALLGAADERNVNKLEQEKMLVRALVALGVGAGTSALLSHLPSGEELVAEAGSRPAVTPDSTPAPQPSAEPTEASTPPEAAPTSESVVAPKISSPAEPAPATPKPQVESPRAKVIDADTHRPKPAISVPEEGTQIDPSAPIFVPEQGSVDPELPEQSAPDIEAPVADPAITTPAEAAPTPLPEGVDPEVPDSPVEVASGVESLPAETAEVSNDTLSTEISEATPSPIQPEHVTSVAPATELPPESVNNDISAESPVETYSSSAAEQIETGTSDNAELANPVDQSQDATIDDSGTSTDADSSATESSASSALESFTNKKGVLIDPSKPHLYQVSEKGALIVWGGTFEQRYATAINTFNQPGNNIRQIALEGKDIDPQTGKPVLGQLVVGDDGSLGSTPALKERYGGFLGLLTKTRPMIPDPDTFTKRIN